MKESNDQPPKNFTTAERRALFLELAGQGEGASTLEVYSRALELGDTVTEEAYYNLARRLVHPGLLSPVNSERGTKYKIGAYSEGNWLEEDDLSALVDQEYPLLALTVWKESRRQINDVPEEMWIELRERLRNQSARQLFHRAIISYADDFRAQIADLIALEENPTPEFSRLRQEAESSRQLLLRLTKFGLGLSTEAIDLPLTLEVAISRQKRENNVSYVDEKILGEELNRRISSEALIVEIDDAGSVPDLLIAAVDGSTRGGVLSFLGEEGDLALGHAPMIAINTAVGQINRALKSGNRTTPVFMRLPERPEDMQRQDNRYTVMAKLLYPDLSDAKYMHSVWNAMDLVESRVALRLLRRWYGPTLNIEIQPSDIVMRDGTVSPQDRDFSHYAEMSSYGQIVRDMIGTNWEIALKCREDGQTLAGVVREAQLTVFAPVINWFACQVAREGTGQLAGWPLQTMNLIPDQALLTRLLTSGRKKRDRWQRTCIVLRPFHAVTNFSQDYSRVTSPGELVLRKYGEATKVIDRLSQGEKLFWETVFRVESDPYVKMLNNVFYGGFFMGSVPRLDIEKFLPRLELVVPATTSDDGASPWPLVVNHLNRFIKALRQTDFQVSAEHSMFRSDAKIDILPGLLIRAHDTVKIWATELLSRVQEFIGYYLARYVKAKRFRGIKVRPFTRDELELLYSQLKQERDLQAGAPSTAVLDKAFENSQQ
jgi:hypothetical protein